MQITGPGQDKDDKLQRKQSLCLHKAVSDEMLQVL
jgi:hypothetical protein